MAKAASSSSAPLPSAEPAAHGAGFAFAYMNNADLPRILDQSAIALDAAVRTAFQNGLVYALTFFDWYVPGLLDAWQPRGSLESELVAHARTESALNRQRGFPLTFRLERPRT